VLDRMSHELKALEDLRQYAAMLLQEAEQMYASDTEAGVPDDDRRRRLQDTLDCARQLYAQRASLEGSAAALLFDELLAAVAASSPPTPFSRDLAHAGPLKEARRTATAS